LKCKRLFALLWQISLLLCHLPLILLLMPPLLQLRLSLPSQLLLLLVIPMQREIFLRRRARRPQLHRVNFFLALRLQRVTRGLKAAKARARMQLQQLSQSLVHSHPLSPCLTTLL
jgi:hypothetical protein